MTDPQEPTLIVSRVRSQRHAAVLAGFFGDLSAADRQQRGDAVLDQAERGAEIFLFEADVEEHPVGAALAVAQEGRTAVVWAPRLFDDRTADVVGDRLMEALLADLQAAGVRIAQALLECDETKQGRALDHAGFDRVGDLLYMVSPTHRFPSAPPTDLSPGAAGLEFVPYSSETRTRLRRVVEATYRETLDCPRLDGVREIHDVLAGYRSDGEFDPRRWLIVRGKGADIGCLLLTDYPETEHWELVYMGLIPEVRGQRLGIEVVRYAQWLTRQAGRLRLILAVDAENVPAINVYLEAGFDVWERRSVFLKIFDR